MREFYKSLNLKENPFHFTKISEKTILDFLKELKTNKATGIDNLSGRFLKDGSKVLATSIAQISNLCIELATVPDDCKIAKLKPLYKIGKKILYFQLFPKSLKMSKKLYTNFSQVFQNFTPQILVSRIYKIR